MSDVRQTWGQTLAAIAFGAGREVPLDHLGPHNAFEWVVYLALLTIFVAVLVHEWRNRNAIPGFRKPRRRNASPDPGTRPSAEAPTVGLDEQPGDPARDPD